jgi:hypothetical protein
MNWPEALMWIGIAFAGAWALRSFMRALIDEKP